MFGNSCSPVVPKHRVLFLTRTTSAAVSRRSSFRSSRRFILAGCVGRKLAWKRIVKLTDRNQLLDFLREVRTHIARRSLNFSHQFGTQPLCRSRSSRTRTPGAGLLTSRRTTRCWTRRAGVFCSFPDSFRIWTSVPSRLKQTSSMASFIK